MNPSESRWTERWAQIKSYFDRHEIVSRGDRWWRCRQPDTSGLGFDVFIDHWGGLMVSGGIEAIYFAPDDLFPSTTPEERVYQVGFNKNEPPMIMEDNVKEAAIGSGHDVVREFNTETAVFDLLSTPEDGSDWDKVRKLAEKVPDLTREQLINRLFELNYDGWESDVGMRPTDRVLYAHAAVARLAELLAAEEKETRQ